MPSWHGVQLKAQGQLFTFYHLKNCPYDTDKGKDKNEREACQ
jgi:hypothetical protein